MSIEIIRYTADNTGHPYVIAETDAWRYELAIEAGEQTIDQVAAELLAQQLKIEAADAEQIDDDRTESVEVIHHTGHGAPAYGVA